MGGRDYTPLASGESAEKSTNATSEQQQDVSSLVSATTSDDAVESKAPLTSLVSQDEAFHDEEEEEDDDSNDEDSGMVELDPSLRMTVDDAIEHLGMGKFQMLVLTAAGLCFAADAMQVLLLSFLSEVLRSEWNLTDDETAFITSMLFIGAIFGTLSLGPMADRRGRKPIFLLAGSIISFFGLTVAFCTNYWSLLSMLFMVGFGVGGLTVPFDILAECIPSHSRGKNLLVIEYFWTIGVLFVVFIAYQTLGNGAQSSNSWRLFVMLCSIPCFVSVAMGVFYVPESPRWLCTVGRCDEALEILRAAAKTNGADPDFLFPPGTSLIAEKEEEADFCELFSPRWRWTTLKLWGSWGAFAFGYYGTIMVITEIFDSEDQNGVNDGSTEAYDFDYTAIFVSSSAELFGTTFAIFAVDRAGRIPLQIVSYSMAGICVCTLCVLASQGAHRKVLISLGFLARIFEMSGSCVSWVATAEILTTDVRTTGHSAANAVARIGSLFAPFLIEGHSSLSRKGFVMLAIHCITVACVSQLPETKGSHMGAITHDDAVAVPAVEEEEEDNESVESDHELI